MADDYQFKEAFSDSKKLREATETGTDADGNPILRNVVAVEPGSGSLDVSAATVSVQESSALDVSAATVTVTDDGQLDINSLPNVTVGTISDTIGVSSLPDVTIGSESAGLAQESTLSNKANDSTVQSVDSSVQGLEAYRSEPSSFDPSSSGQTPQCDAFMIPDGSNTVRTIELKATAGGTLQTITVPTNAVIPMAVEETGTGGNATSFLALNQ